MFGMILELMRIFPDVISAMASAHRQKHQSTQINTIKNTVQPTLQLLASNAGTPGKAAYPADSKGVILLCNS